MKNRTDHKNKRRTVTWVLAEYLIRFDEQISSESWKFNQEQEIIIEVPEEEQKKSHFQAEEEFKTRMSRQGRQVKVVGSYYC